MTRRIYTFEHEGRQALGFDTGLDSRAFARARFDQFIAEPGFIVFAGGGIETWKAEGVIEAGGSMVIWGPLVAGERLDMLAADTARRDDALAALGRWINAWLLLAAQNGDAAALPSIPCAVIISAAAVFFAPSNLALRCAQTEAEDARLSGKEWYVHPDLAGGEAAVFTAAALFYRILSGEPPFTAADESLLHQDMREGNFLPVRFALPGLNEQLAELIQLVLAPAADGGGRRTEIHRDGEASLRRFLALVQSGESAASFSRPLSAEERLKLTKEKEQFLKRKNITVKTRRFVTRNRTIILGCAAALIIALFTAHSIIKSRSELPTTKGMTSDQVIQSYYNAFGELDHALMEACLAKGVGKGDVEMVINLYVISKIRQAYEGAGTAELPVFGVTDLRVERLSGGEDANEVRCLARYTLWLPFRGENETETAGASKSVQYTDELTLARQKGDWRITEIKRTGN
jgi:hypothetical protein